MTALVSPSLSDTRSRDLRAQALSAERETAADARARHGRESQDAQHGIDEARAHGHPDWSHRYAYGPCILPSRYTTGPNDWSVKDAVKMTRAGWLGGLVFTTDGDGAEASCDCGATGDAQSIREHIESRVCPEGGSL